jgi:hypothetical protein
VQARLPDGHAPRRRTAYSLRTGTGADSSSDPTHYVPGELMELWVTVEQRVIRGKLNAGATLAGWESAKYIGLLLYAVVLGDLSETKVLRALRLHVHGDGLPQLPRLPLRFALPTVAAAAVALAAALALAAAAPHHRSGAVCGELPLLRCCV